MPNNLESTRLAPYAGDCVGLDERFNNTHLHEPVLGNAIFLALALTGEVGEMTNILKKIWRDGESPELWKKFDEEMVDILIYFIELLNTTKCPFDEAWIAKYKELYLRMTSRSSLKGYSILPDMYLPIRGGKE